MALIPLADWIDRHGDAAIERVPERPHSHSRSQAVAWLHVQLVRAIALSVSHRSSRDRMSKLAAPTVLNRRLRRA